MSEAAPGQIESVVIDVKAVAARVRERVAAAVGELAPRLGRAPGLATVLVGEDPASHVYVSNKRKACAKAGIESFHHELDASVGRSELLDLIADLNSDDEVDGILAQMPLPEGLSDQEVTAAIAPSKDVDGLTPASAGMLAQGRSAAPDVIGGGLERMARGEAEPTGMVPCTPSGIMQLLADAGIETEGAEALVIGRSTLVGRPIASLLLQANATVTMAHSRTADLPGACARADILVAAAGVPRMVQGSWIKPGATVIDVGINRTDDGLVGDVDYESALGRAGAITPVPGGVGPMTIAMLLANTVAAAAARVGAVE